jgi:hypothetical protein
MKTKQCVPALCGDQFAIWFPATVATNQISLQRASTGQKIDPKCLGIWGMSI